jgi:hypothetical protein
MCGMEMWMITPQNRRAPFTTEAILDQTGWPIRH